MRLRSASLSRPESLGCVTDPRCETWLESPSTDAYSGIMAVDSSWSFSVFYAILIKSIFDLTNASHHFTWLGNHGVSIVVRVRVEDRRGHLAVRRGNDYE